MESENESDVQRNEENNLSRKFKKGGKRRNRFRSNSSDSDDSTKNGENNKEGSKIIRSSSNSSIEDESKTLKRSRSSSSEGDAKNVRKNSNRSRSNSLSDSEDEIQRKRKVLRSRSNSSSSEYDRKISNRIRRSRSNSSSSEVEQSNLSENRRSRSNSSDGELEPNEAPKVVPDISEDESDQDLDKNTTQEEIRRSPEPISDDEGVSDRQGGLMLDFDRMIQRKKDENRRHKKKTGIDVINDNDDAIAKMIADMRQAARDDRALNSKGMPATKKIGMLPAVLSQLNKADLVLAFVEANVLSVITDWLAPMGEKNILPHVQIRSRMLQFCDSIPLDSSRLKESGIGKAVMYLSRNPKETRENKELTKKLISKWSRPIFNLEDNFASMTREERQKRDREMAVKLREITESRGSAKANRALAEAESSSKALRPGDPGWICRARVPMVDNREYVVRPEWQTTVDISRGPAKQAMTRLEKQKRLHADRKRNSKMQSAVKLSLEGKNHFM